MQTLLGRGIAAAALVIGMAGAALPAEAQDWDIRKADDSPKPRPKPRSDSGSDKPERERGEDTLEAYRAILEGDPREGYVLDKVLQLAEKVGGVPALIASYEQRASARPDDTASFIILGHLHKATGDTEAAVASYQKAVALAPSDPLPLVSIGNAQAAREQWDPALAAFEGALGKTSSKAERQDLLRLIARTAFSAGRSDAARDALARLVATDPGSLYLRMDAAQELSRNGTPEQALPAWQDVAKRASGDRQAWLVAMREMAGLEERLGRDDEALRLYREALSAAPRGSGADREIRERVVALYRKQGRLPELIAEYEKKAGGDFELTALLGRLFEETGDDGKALEAYRKAARMQPRSLEARKQVIQLLERTGSTEDVIAEYRELIRLAPREPQFELKLADLLQRAGQKDKALDTLRKIGRKYPNDPSVHSALVDTLVRFGGEPADIERAFERLRKLEPNEEGHVLGLGEFYFGRNDVTRAVSIWKQLLRVIPNKAQAHFRLAETYAEHDMPDAAEPAFQKALTLAPDNRKFHKRYAEFLESQRRTDRAVREWASVIELAGDDKSAVREARAHIIRLHSGAGALKSKLVEMREAFEQTPPDMDAGYFLAEGHLFLKEYEAAEGVYRRILTLSPDDVEATLALESVLVKRGDVAGAMQLAHRLAKIDEAGRALHLGRAAEYAMQLGEEASALATAQGLVELSPTDPNTHAKLADILRQMGDLEGAMREYQRAVELGQRDYRVHFRLARMYHDLDRYEDEDQVLRRVVREADDPSAVLRAGQRLIQINAYLGRLAELEEMLLPLVFQREHKYVYRRLLVDLYHRTARELSHRLEADPGDRSAEVQLRALADRGLKPLLDALEEEDVSIRTKAVEVLRDTRSPNAVLPLVRLLDGRDPELRFQAAVALAYGGSEAAVPALVRLVDEPDNRLREVGIWALGAIRGASALVPLRTVLTQHDSGRMRSIAALALGMRGNDDARDTLVAALSDGQPVVRQNAVWALGALGDDRAVPALEERLRTDVPDVQRTIVWSLGRIASPRVVSPLLRQLWTDDLHEQGLFAWALWRAATGPHDRRAELLADREIYLDLARFRQADLLIAQAIPLLSTEVVPLEASLDAAMIRGFSGPIGAVAGALLARDDAPVQRSVLAALDGPVGQPRLQLTSLLDELHGSEAEAAQAELRAALGPALSRLVELAAARDPELRALALRVLGKVTPPGEVDGAVISAIEGGLRAEQPAVREAAIVAAGLTRDRRLFEPVAATRTDTEAGGWPTRLALAEALGRMEDRRALPVLGALRKDPSPVVRAAAALALADVGGQEAVSELLEALSDPDASVVSAAAAGLGRVGDPRALSELERLRSTVPIAARSEVDGTIARLRGFGPQ